MSGIELLTWVIGLGGTLFAVLMGVMWSYVLRQGSNLYAYIKSTSEDLKREIDKMAEQAREDAGTYDSRFARKEEVNKIEGTVNAMRQEMSTNFTALNTQMGGISTQMTAIVTVLTKQK